MICECYKNYLINLIIENEFILQLYQWSHTIYFIDRNNNNYIIEFSVINRYTNGAVAWYKIKIKTVTDYSREKNSVLL